MKKILSVFALSIAALSIGACGQMNTVIRPYTETRQDVKDVQAVITRADRSGVYVGIKNNTKEDIEIVWDKSTLGGVRVTQGAYIDREEHKIARINTRLKPEDIFRTVLHRENDVYYLDPVLYQPGGVRIKPLVYPTLLTLRIKKGEVEADSIIYIEHEHSLNRKAVEARVEKEYLKEMKSEDGNYYFYKDDGKVYKDNMSQENRILLEELLENDTETEYKLREDRIIVK